MPALGLLSPVTNLSLLLEFDGAAYGQSRDLEPCHDANPRVSCFSLRVCCWLLAAAEQAPRVAGLTSALELSHHASVLAALNIWALIGDQDVRVYTDSLARLMRTVQCDGCSPGRPP